MITNIPENLEKEVRALIGKMADVKPEGIDPNAHFFRELGLDSLQAIEIATALQKKFDIRIDDDRLPELTTINKILNEVNQLLN